MSLKEAVKKHGDALVRSIRDGDGCNPSEADDHLNDSSIGVIRAMVKEHGEAWLVKINLYDKDRTPLVRAIPDRESDGYNCWNFCCGAVIPKYSQELWDLILERADAVYTGTKSDYVRVDKIFELIEKLGGQTLIWS